MCVNVQLSKSSPVKLKGVRNFIRIEAMTANEKLQIYTLLKTAADSLCRYKSPSFAGEVPSFSDDVTIVPQTSTPQPHVAVSSAIVQNTEVPLQPQLSASLENIAKKICECTRCPLSKTRTNTVPGTGVSSPFVLVIGEGPGYEEDMQGLPFVGPAGKLLDKMLASIKLSRSSNTYIANIVKCRPPMNRNPYPEEADACSSFLQAQIAVLKPKAILCVGTVAAKNLLKTELGVTKLRGNFYEYCKIPVAVTYHPSALLRDEQLKRPAWEDLKLFRSKLLEICPDYENHFGTSAD